MRARSGRRPGQPATREAILAAARSRFAEVGYDKASIRSIASGAGVDSALVHHYFGTKRNLFIAVARIPVNPETVLAALQGAPVDELGATIVRTVVGVWDSPAGAGLVAALRGVMAGGQESLIRSFLLDIALKNVGERVDDPPGSGRTRVALVASQMVGLLAARKILEVEPLASMPLDEVVDHIGPTLQRYLTGPLPRASKA
nr:TetR family transcriptional regulator [Skermania sp. ID1734]